MITTIKGDATYPEGRGNKIIAHVCNDIGGWGRGFVLAISKRWEKPEKDYKQWFASGSAKLGSIQLVEVEEYIFVVNMIAQSGIYPKSGLPPIRYESLRKCLSELNFVANLTQATVHMPKIGAGLAGGDWDKIYKIIEEELTVDVVIYEWDGAK